MAQADSPPASRRRRPDEPVYMDNHATTCVDPRVVDAMLPFFTEKYGNAGSVSHPFGWEAKEAVDEARRTVARSVGASEKEIVFTSGATESNNLAIRGLAERPGRKGNHVITVATEHRSVLDPIERLGRRGFEVTLLDVEPAGGPHAGRVSVDRLADAIRPDTLLVSVMLANNEIGVIQPIDQIGQLCRERHVLLHCDATQGVGKLPVDVDRLQVDLISLSAHKIYGPKGIGALFVRRRDRPVRLQSQISGGGQEGGVRSGTLQVAGIVGLAQAAELCSDEMESETVRLAALRNRLFEAIASRLPHVTLCGPSLDLPDERLAGNLTVSFGDVDGEALLMSMEGLAVSSGAACTSAHPEPSHVLRALGLRDEMVRSSLRFGLGRFNTPDQIDWAVDTVVDAVDRLRRMGGPAA